MADFKKLRKLKIRHSLKVVAINLCVFVACWACIEIASLGFIASGIIALPSQAHSMLLQRVPAQFRLDSISRTVIYGSWTVRRDAKLAVPLNGLIDQEIGSIRPLNIEAYVNSKILRMEWMNADVPLYLQQFWNEHDTHTYGKLSEFFTALRKEIGKDMPILFTFGGSTTAFTLNWPYFLQQEAAKNGHDIAILNLAQAGWVVQNYTDFYTHWHNILLDEIGRAPDAVLSLSGTNDLTLYAMGYTDFKRNTLPFWNPHRSAIMVYDMKVDNERETHSIASFFYHLVPDLFAIDSLTSFFIDAMPYTSAAVKYAGVSHTSDEVESSQTEMKLPEEVQEKLLSALETRIRAFHGMLKANGLCHLGYLQPMALNAFYPFNVERKSALHWNSIASMPQATEKGSGGAVGGDYVLSPDGFFEKAPGLYGKLNNAFPGHYINLASLFASEQQDLYADDSIHYSAEGSKLIAKAIYTDLQKKGLFTPSRGVCR